MPRFAQSTKPTLPRWTVNSARKSTLLQHKSLDFKFQKVEPDQFHVTHVSEKGSGDWMDTAAAVASMAFPELAPLIGMASPLIKSLLGKAERKAPKHAPHSYRPPVPEGHAVSPGILEALSQNPRPVQSAMNPVRFAPMPVRLNAADVPVLHGQTGQMPLLPVTIQRTESHATMAGSEFLGTLQLQAAQTAVGLNVFTINVNPRAFPGTKLTAEALTWTSYRFRKFVVEYIPIQGSAVTGSFVGYFTNDPFEPDVGGVDAIRNATEHVGAMIWQPFFHNVFGMVDIEADKHLYFCRNEPDSDPRLEMQALFKVIQTVSNTTGIPYGTFMFHYEVDFYYPETNAVSSAGVVTSPNWLTNNSAIAGDFAINSANSNQVGFDDVYSYIVSGLPANATTSVLFRGPDSQYISLGQTVYLRRVPTDSSGFCYVYSTLAAADANDLNGRAYYGIGKTPPANGSSVTLIPVAKILGHTLAAARGLGLTTHPQDETPNEQATQPSNRTTSLSTAANYQYLAPPGTALPDLDQVIGPPPHKYRRS
jgi:hypothetical protein